MYVVLVCVTTTMILNEANRDTAERGTAEEKGDQLYIRINNGSYDLVLLCNNSFDLVWISRDRPLLLLTIAILCPLSVFTL